MKDRKAQVAALLALGARTQPALRGWVPFGDLPSEYHQALGAAVDKRLAEFADRDTRAELSALAGHPVPEAARLTTQGHDAVAYIKASSALPSPEEPSDEGLRLIQLRPSEMDVVRVYVSIAPQLHVPPADGLAEKVRTAAFDKTANRWTLRLTSEQVESVAYAFYLHACSVSVGEANRFARTYNISMRVDSTTGEIRPTPL
ncbi:DUF6417 family protein [Streptomyces sp. SCSIO 30461]|uniref:DUF6417 family protein n=1 Tax=Streptomyces sp. SCSIO 30461 TaxID=3118085 RepID=UPI0030D5E259